MSGPDLEALVTPRIAEAVQAAVDKIGRREFEAVTGITDQLLAAILAVEDVYVAVAFVTLACQINRSRQDVNLAHSSVTECLKGSTIRIPPAKGSVASIISTPRKGQRVTNLYAQPRDRRRRETRPFRLLGFSVNTIIFIVLGYFLGGTFLSEVLGQPACIGLGSSPPSLGFCAGSAFGIVLGAIGGLGYTYYYFVTRVR